MFRICPSSHHGRNWSQLICMEMNGIFGTFSEVDCLHIGFSYTELTCSCYFSKQLRLECSCCFMLCATRLICLIMWPLFSLSSFNYLSKYTKSCSSIGALVMFLEAEGVWILLAIKFWMEHGYTFNFLLFQKLSKILCLN